MSGQSLVILQPDHRIVNSEFADSSTHRYTHIHMHADTYVHRDLKGIKSTDYISIWTIIFGLSDTVSLTKELISDD